MDVSEARRILGVDANADLLTLARARDQVRQQLARSRSAVSSTAVEQQSRLEEQTKVNEAYTLLAGLKVTRPRSRAVPPEAVPRDGLFWILVVAGALVGGALTKIGSPASELPEISQSIEWLGLAVVGGGIGALLRWVAFAIQLRTRARRRSKLLAGRRQTGSRRTNA
jgi:hypothetical protein